MAGLLLALFYLGWLWLFSGAQFEPAYYFATNLLFKWYCVWSFILAAPVIVIAVILSVLIAALKSNITKVIDEKRVVGKLFRWAVGSLCFLAMILLFAVKRSGWLFAAYLAHTSLIVRGDIYAYHWNFQRLALGAFIFLLSVLWQLYVDSRIYKKIRPYI